MIFLAEAFTRPKVMHRLAKLGFTQSYTYFTWRNTKPSSPNISPSSTHGPGREYFRPNCWPNTPDILPEYLQFGGRPAFMARLVLAATLSANYGIYGPAFELLEHVPREPGSEEYLDSEKYEIRHWDLDRADSLAAFIARVNAARRDNPALQRDGEPAFFPIDNDELICYAKVDADRRQRRASSSSTSIRTTRSRDGSTLDLAVLGHRRRPPVPGARPADRRAVPVERPAQFRAARPGARPGAVFRLRRRVRTERDFDYFL